MEKHPLRSLWPRTLRAQLVLLLVIFWAIPLVALSTYTVLVYRANVTQEMRSTLDSRLYYAVLLSNEKLAGTLTVARSVTYDTTLEKLTDDFLAAQDPLPEDDSRAPEQARLDETRQQLRTGCVGYLTSHFSLNSDILMAILVTDVLPEVTYTGERTNAALFNYYATFVAARAQGMASSLGTRIGFLVSNQHLYLVRNLWRTDNTAPYGRLVLELNTDSVFRFLLDALPENATLVVQPDGQPLVLSRPTYDETEPTVIAPEDSGIREKTGYLYFTGWFPGRDYDLGYEVSFPSRSLDSARSLYNRLLAIVGLVSLIFFILIYSLFRLRFARPLESLSSAAWALKNGDLGVHAQASSKDDEIGLLVQSFNAMSDQMQNLFNRVYREQLALKDARIIALQSQINPHFFNNTLELMNWKARMLGDEQLSDMIQALSTLLDSAMDRSHTRFIPLRDELAVGDAYLTIITARFGNRLTVVKEIDETRLDAPVPRMILQPLLENAVVHGLEPAGGGTLRLQITSQGSTLEVSILNDGVPLSAEDEAHIDRLLTQPMDPTDPRSQRLGIRNVNERLTLIYGDAAMLHFSRDAQGHTLCRFRIPPVPRKQENLP